MVWVVVVVLGTSVWPVFRIDPWSSALLRPVRLGPPCRRPILNATTSPLYVRRYTRGDARGTEVIQDAAALTAPGNAGNAESARSR